MDRALAAKDFTMTYKQAYDKIIDAYFKDEIIPMNCNFCFCGTLAHDSSWWKRSDHRDKSYPYSVDEYNSMEAALFGKLYELGKAERWKRNPKYEEVLFAGMSAAVDVLKQIHIERGEVIDEVPVFTKRQLNNQNQ
jgi:hypothetical protein